MGFALASAPVACAPAQVHYERELDRAPPGAAHGVHSERLLELMHGLERLSRERLPRAMNVAEAEAGRAAQIEAVALALADSAREIPAAARGAPLSEGERRAFDAAAAQLEEVARALGRSAGRSPEQLEPAVRSVEDVCASCHADFRAGQDAD